MLASCCCPYLGLRNSITFTGLHTLRRNHNQNLSYKYCNYSFVSNLVRNLGISQLQLGLSLNGPATILLSAKHFSTETTIEENQQGHSFKVSYLINSCGLSPEAAISASNKVHFTSPDNPDSVLAIFRKYGFGNTHISSIIRKFPVILTYSPEQIFPKLDFFRSLGFSDSELAQNFTSKPYILQYSLQNRIIPCYDFLKSVLVTNTEVVAAMRRGDRIFYTDVLRRLRPNVQVLRQAGVPHSVISFAFRRCSNLFCLSNHHFVAKVKEVMELGVDPTRQSFALALEVVIVMSNAKWQRKVQVFKSWGCSDDEISAAFRKYPAFMLVSEKKIMSAMEFLVKEMGLKPSDIIRYPTMLNSSLEKSNIPRFSVVRFLQLKGLLKKDLRPTTFLKPSKREFLDKYVDKYEKQAPQLLSLYQGSLGFGEDALQSLPGKIGTQDVHDVLTAIDHAIDMGLADPSKILVFGGSHGGFLTTHLIGQAPDKFVAAAVRNPLCNIALMAGTSDIPDWCFVEALGREGITSFSEAPPPEILTLFHSKSPIAHLPKVKTPTLFLLGAKDLRLPVSNALQYARALKEKGVPVKVMIFPHDVHGLERPQSDFESFLNIGVWFKKYCK